MRHNFSLNLNNTTIKGSIEYTAEYIGNPDRPDTLVSVSLDWPSVKFEYISKDIERALSSLSLEVLEFWCYGFVEGYGFDRFRALLVDSIKATETFNPTVRD